MEQRKGKFTDSNQNTAPDSGILVCDWSDTACRQLTWLLQEVEAAAAGG